MCLAGFVTIQDGVNVFHSIKQLYYSNYLTSSLGDPLSTRSLVPGPRGPQGENLGFDQFVGNVTGPNFDNFLQSSLPQDRKFAQFSASVAPIGFAGTDTKVSESVTVAWDSTPDSLNITFPAGNNPDLVAAGINDTYVLNTVTWNGTLSQSPFISSFAPLTVGAEVAADNTSLVITGGPGTTTLTNQPLTSFTYNGIGVGASIDVVAVASVVTKITITVAGDNYEAGDVITITAAQMNSFGGLSTFGGSTTFTILQSDLTPETSTINANLLVPNGVNPNVATNKRGLTLRNNNSVNFITAGGAGTFTLNYLLAPRGPSVISIPSKLFGERVQPSSFQFEYTSSLNFTRSIVEDDGQGNLIVTQSNAAGTPFFSGSVGQIFYSQGIAVITGPDSGSLREFAHNVGYKNNMNPNIVSSSIAYSSSISIDENQYKCVVRNNEFLNTTNPSALGPAGELSKSNNQLFSSFDAGTLNLAASANNVYAMQPRNIVGDVKATTFYIFGDRATTTTIGQQYIVELESSGGKNLQYVGYDGNENGTLNSLGQVQFNSTGSAVGIAKGFCDAINSSEGFNGQISASLQSTVSGLDTVKLTQDQAGTIGNTFIKYTDSFNLLLAEGAYAPIPPRGQVRFGNTLQPAGNPQPVDGTDTFNATKGAILNVTVNSNAITNITVSSSISSMGISQSFSGRGYNAGDRLEILASQVGAGSGAGLGTGSISLTQTDVINEGGSEIYHDFVTGSYFSPFVTTVGLYNKNSDLIAVGKFPRPIPISLQTDTTYVINFDTN